MAQIHLSVDQRTATELAARAAAKGQSLSRYLADIVRCQVAQEWPDGYLRAVIGSCADEPLRVVDWEVETPDPFAPPD